MVQVGVESENGWRPATLPPDSALLIWKTIPGTSPPVTIQVMRGLPEVFLPAWAADWNAYIEHVDDADTASYTPTNIVNTSNHLNGTAEDIDWDKHPFQVVGTVTADQRATLTDMLAFYEGWMFWAGNWDDPIDEMHSQMGYNTWNRNTAAFDFIARKIRSDGLSIFHRGVRSPTDPPNAGTPPVAPTPDPATPDTPTQVLYDAVPVIDMNRAGQLVDAVMAGLMLAQCDQGNRQRRIAMALAQWGHESDGFITTEEYGKGAGKPYFPYYGRAWTQVTWQSNYAAFGVWCVQQKLITDPNQFVNDPASLADLKWAGIASAWFWITPHSGHNLINDDSDAGNVAAVTETINGGDTGLQDRIDRYNQALALGDRILLLIPAPLPVPPIPGGPLDALTPDEQHQLLDDVAWIREQLGPNIWGPDSSMGTAADGHELTVRDGLAATRREVDGMVGVVKALAQVTAAVTPPVPPGVST